MGFISAASPQLPCSNTHIINVSLKCADRRLKHLFFCCAGWEGLLLDQAHSRQPCTIWGMELLAQSEWSVLWGQSGEVLQVYCTSRNHAARPYRSVIMFMVEVSLSVYVLYHSWRTSSAEFHACSLVYLVRTKEKVLGSFSCWVFTNKPRSNDNKQWKFATLCV